MFNFYNKAESGKRKAAGRKASAPRRRARSPRSYSLQPTAYSLRRRGVLLLVVLSLLVLFLMVGTAFVITAKQSEKAAKAANRGTARLSAAAAKGDLLDEVLKQIIRDTNNPNSSLRFHSLLGDMYGADGFSAQILNPKWADRASGTANTTGGQMVEFELTPGTLRDLYGVPITGAIEGQFLSPLDSAYNGLVLTFVGGGAAGQSSRIVGYRAPGSTQPNAVLTVMAPVGPNGALTDPAILLGSAGTRVVVNGRPFSGTGFGFNPTRMNDSEPTARLSLHEKIVPTAGTNHPVALMPNARYLDPQYLALAPSTGASPNQATRDAAPSLVMSVAQLTKTPALSNQERSSLAARIGPAGIGGANESYDVADYQNMALAYVPAADLTDTVLTGAFPPPTPPPALSANGRSMVLPSWHRPDLVNYWNETLKGGGGSLGANAILLRKVVMRPTWVDHPEFTGSNPEFSQLVAAYEVAAENGDATAISTASNNLVTRTIYGPWDVDNDNDGVRDSIWVDVGLPVIAGPDGKLVKPLAAIMIVDMDGRLNVNAHGSPDLANLVGDSTVDSMLADGSTEAKDTPRGSGYGPADVSLQDIVGGDDFYRLLTGRYEPGHARAGEPVTFRNEPVGPGRYGFIESGTTPAGAGRDKYYDILSQVGFFGWPNRANQSTSFATPPDLGARYGAGVNIFGQPVFEATFNTEINNTDANLAIDSPYEMNLSQSTVMGVTGVQGTSAADTPFSLAELERALRLYDADAGSLPSRLLLLAGIELPDDTSGNPDRSDRNKITTDSYDLPVPNVSLPPAMRPLLFTPPASPPPSPAVTSQRRLPRSVAELIEIRVRATKDNNGAPKYPLFPQPLSPQQATDVRGIVRQLLAPELADGLRLNINRALGNGVDDDLDGTVDEAGELDQAGAPANAWSINRQNVTAAAAVSGYDVPKFPPNALAPAPANDGSLVEVDHRQLLARHLYVMALTTSAPADFGTAADATDQERDKDLARQLAQWAANVVDFRDADSSMTIFEYDLNPFDGWDVDGVWGMGSADDMNPNRGVVIGAERPELLMTETLAWHDRRTDNSAQAQAFPEEDGPDEAMDLEDPENKEKDFDSLSQPRGAFFMEVYNPWPSSPGASADLHAMTPVPDRVDQGVNLAAMSQAPDGDDPSPVWRFAIYKRKGVEADVAATWDPDHSDAAKRPKGPIDRTIYLTGQDPKFDDDGVAFFNHPNNRTPPVRPGRYMVIGSGTEKAAGVYETRIGDRKGARNPDNPNRDKVRRIELVTDNVERKVRMVDADADAVDDITAPELKIQSPTEATLVDPDGASPALAERAYEGDASLSVTDVAIVNYATDPTGNSRGIKRRLTLSEPAAGYIERFRGSRWNETKDQYETGDGTLMPIDVPLDGPIGGDAALEVQYGPMQDGKWPTYLAARNPVTKKWESYVDPVLTQIRDPGAATNPDLGASYSLIYLQRLADPQFPWNPEPGKPGHDANRPVNPYVTVDNTSANLTVFNSRGNTNVGKIGEEEDGSPANNAGARFTSHERGYSEMKDAVTAGGDLTQFMPTNWSYERPSAERLKNERRKIRLLETPRNEFFATQANRLQMEAAMAESESFTFNRVPYCSLGYMNRVFVDPNLAPGPGRAEARQLVPKNPFPWVAWNNRPYLSGNELLLVPRVRSSVLLKQFVTGEPPLKPAAPGQGRPSSYTTPMPSADFEPQPDDNLRPAFSHLTNFLYETPAVAPSVTPPTAPPPTIPALADLRRVPSGLYRMLEYVQTPSLYAGTQTWLSPEMFSAAIAPQAPNAVSDPRLNRQAPFNTISQFRDPGRVNLNTVAASAVPASAAENSDVWDGLFHRQSGAEKHDGPEFAEWVFRRRGYGANTQPTLQLDANVPTFFSNPLRAAGSAEMVPPVGDPSSGTNNPNRLVRAGADVTLLRSRDGTVTTGTSRTLTSPRADGAPLLAGTTIDEHDHAQRNDYFHYRPMTRLDNLATSRSNVYAVWVTIGFFEVEPVPTWAGGAVQANYGTQAIYNKVFPDGYRLAKENGVDTGEIRRLRGFYIIDRTMPAAFEPGVDHNVENVIRLRRRIE